VAERGEPPRDLRVRAVGGEDEEAVVQLLDELGGDPAVGRYELVGETGVADPGSRRKRNLRAAVGIRPRLAAVAPARAAVVQPASLVAHRLPTLARAGQTAATAR
jgi:hypothetical protein